MRVSHAVFVSVTLHAALLAGLLYTPTANLPNRVSPPNSTLQARVLAYQEPAIASQLAPPQAADAPVPKPTEPIPVVDGTKSNQLIQSDNASKEVTSPKPDLANLATPTTTRSTGTSGIAVFESAALDTAPSLQSDISIDYPLSANNREGVVSLALVVGADGRVESVLVVKATPAGFFEAAAIKGFQNARFSAGTIAGVGVKSRLVVEVEFTPTNRGGGVSGQRN